MPSCTNNRLTGRQPCHLRTIGCFLIAPELHLIDYEKAQKMGVGENSQGVGLMQQKDHTLVFWSNGGKVYLAVIISWYCWHGVIGHMK